MRPILKRITGLCAGTLLLACAGVGQRPVDPLAVQAQAEESYLLGRTYHMSLRFESALAHYADALRAVPSHVKTRNGLAALYAEQKQLPQAIALWKELTASATGGGSAYLFRNLGHAYMLQGEAALAQVALSQACVLDPLDEAAWQLLGDAFKKLGQPERAEAMHRQAQALRGPDLKSDYARAQKAGAPASDSAVPVARADDDGFARTDISRAADGTFVMRRIESDPSRVRPAANASFAGNVLLEISNGNGITGMARSLAREEGLGTSRAVRLTNQKGFAVLHTRVEYKSAFKADAERLANRYGTTRVVDVGRSGRADVRLVLGRDMRSAVRPAIATVQKPGATPG